MELKDLLGMAVKMATDKKFSVVINDQVSEMTYLELGTLLVSNSDEIERIEVIFR